MCCSFTSCLGPGSLQGAPLKAQGAALLLALWGGRAKGAPELDTPIALQEAIFAALWGGEQSGLFCLPLPSLQISPPWQIPHLHTRSQNLCRISKGRVPQEGAIPALLLPTLPQTCVRRGTRVRTGSGFNARNRSCSLPLPSFSVSPNTHTLNNPWPQC